MRRLFRGRKEAVIDVVVVAGLWQLSSFYLPPILAPSLLEIGRELVEREALLPSKRDRTGYPS